METIKHIVFDLGGVVIALSYEQAVKRFEEIGLKDARQHLDAFHQKGIFGQLEDGSIGKETFRQELSQLIGREVTTEECFYAWHGYVEAVPKRNLEMLTWLRQRGYRVSLLSNTNPYMMQWAQSSDFDGEGHPIDDGKANVEAANRLGMQTLCPQNNEDWTGMVLAKLGLTR